MCQYHPCRATGLGPVPQARSRCRHPGLRSPRDEPSFLPSFRALFVVSALAFSLSPLGLSAADVDADGMDDAWEVARGLNPADPADAALDPDGDALTNLEEHALGTEPFAADTDGDTVPDGTEVISGMDPLAPALQGDGYRYEERG